MKALLKYLIGTDLYKKKKLDEIISQVNHTNSETLSVLRSTHLILGFISLKNELGLLDKDEELLQYQSYQQEISKIICNEVSLLDDLNKVKKHPIVLLKGISFAERYYKNSFDRKIGDIDILIESGPLFLEFENTITGHGYQKHVVPEEDSNYVWSVFSKGFDVENRKVFERFKCKNYLDGKFYMPIDVHKKPFLLKEGHLTYSSYTKMSSSFVNLREFKDSLNLVYLSIKIYVDVYYLNRNESKSLSFFKLIKDYVEILKIVTSEGLKEAQGFALELKVVREFEFVFSIASPLAPEFTSLHPTVVDDSFIDKFIDGSLQKIAPR